MARFNGQAGASSVNELLDQVRCAHDEEVRCLLLDIASLRNQLRQDAQATATVCVADVVAADEGESAAAQAVSDGALSSTRARSDGESDAACDRQPSVQSHQDDRPRQATRGLSKDGPMKTRRRMAERHHTINSRDCLHRLVKNPLFDAFFVLLILLNGAVLAAEAQYNSFDLALQSGHSSAALSSADTWVSGQEVLNVMDWIFGVTFCLELLVKIAGLKFEFVRDPWNWMDAVIVLLWVYDVVGRYGGLTEMPVNAQILRLSRVARLMRLGRVMKSLRSSHFDSLYLITTALKGSLAILSWTVLMLLLIHMVLALLVNQILREYYFSVTPMGSSSEAKNIYKYYGSFSRSLLTMFEISLANWPLACRLLVENVSEWFIIYTLLHKMVLGFAVLGVVNGVFVQETFRSAALDDAVMVKQTEQRQKAHHDKMRMFFEEADVNGDGAIDADEWRAVCDDEWVRLWLASQDLTVKDADVLFDMLDDGDGLLTAEELVRGAYRLKGGASNLDVISMLKSVAEVMAQIKPLVAERKQLSL